MPVSVVEINLEGKPTAYALSFCGLELKDGEFIVLDEASCYWLRNKIELLMKDLYSNVSLNINFVDRTVALCAGV